MKIIPIRVTGFVNHTDKWNQNRISYNLAKTETDNSPRTYDVFFPGENFLLNAETQGDVQTIKVEILGTQYSTYLTKSNNIWRGELWDEQMLKWDTRNIVFRFTATSTSDYQKTYDVPIKIEADPYWRQHGTY